jgi:hypothetical protein
MRYTTAEIRLIFNGIQEFVDPDGEWAEVFRLASDELEDRGVPVFCAYLDATGDTGRSLTAEDFQGAHHAFRGASYSGVDYAAHDHLAEEIGRSPADMVSPFMDWQAYREKRYPHLLVEFDGMFYEFTKER